MTPEDESNRYSEDECFAEFDRLFPHGFAGADVIAELAPEGWANSPWVALFHPSAQQIHEELLRMRRNMQALARPDKTAPEVPEPTLAEIEKDFCDTPVEIEEEARSLVGRCVWEIFSDNHEVVGSDGRVYDLGSFRYAGELLANYVNGKLGTERYDYMDFYLGTVWVSGRADISPVYRMIFRWLKARGLDWNYHFPTLHAIDFRPLRDKLKEDAEPEWANYSPEESLAKEQEETQHDRELAEFREKLDEGNREAMEEALKNPPPKIVAAYHDVYGKYPEGWPPIP